MEEVGGGVNVIAVLVEGPDEASVVVEVDAVDAELVAGGCMTRVGISPGKFSSGTPRVRRQLAKEGASTS